MGSSGGGSGNPMYLSQGGTPIPGLPIAGQGAPNDDPHKFGTYQSFLPDLPAAGGGPAPSATGLTQEMLQYKGPQGQNPEADALRQQLAALQAQRAGGGAAPAAAAAAATGRGQFGFAGNGSGNSSSGGQPFDWTNGSFTPGGLTAGG